MSNVIIVPGRHGRTSAVWWVDAFNRSVELAGKRSLLVEVEANGRPVTDVRQVLLDPVRERWLVVAEGLPEGSEITVRVSGRISDRWTSLKTRTLSDRSEGFTLATGSCFALGQDPGGVLAAGYRALCSQLRVDLRVLTGDQIYMDRDPNTAVYFAKALETPYAEPTVRPSERYEHQWREPRWHQFLAATPTLCLADDHEFWNDYPRHPPYLQYPGLVPVGDFLTAFDIYQSALNVRSDALPKDPSDAAESVRRGRWRSITMDAPLVSIMLLDTRTRRESPGEAAMFTTAKNLEMLTRWTSSLTRPGVLFLSQPLSEGAPEEHYGADPEAWLDSALRHYPAQYRALCQAIAEAPHDVLVVSGDVHWSRVRALDLVRATAGGTPRRVYEVVTSNLTESLPGASETSGVLPEGMGHWSQCATASGKFIRTTGPFGLATLSFRAGSKGSIDVDVTYWSLAAPPSAVVSSRLSLR